MRASSADEVLSSKLVTGTPSTPAICAIRAAPTRFAPLSYFWICWNATPMPRAQFALREAVLEPVNPDVLTNQDVNRVGTSFGHR